ncbi:MAG: hypothetical protein Q9227_008273 [Pyrenula ochraceoflavens]
MDQGSNDDCLHTSLTFVPSAHARRAGYRHPTPKERALAATLQNPPTINADKRSKKSNPVPEAPSPSTFPAPLVLPGDDLAEDPEWPPQTFTEFFNDPDRNKITPSRNTIYLAAAPSIGKEVDFMHSWFQSPHFDSPYSSIPQPSVDDIASYISAFYHPMPVRILPTKLKFSVWEEDDAPSNRKRRKSNATTNKDKPKYVALQSLDESTRIRVRPCPDSVFPYQLNLNDILDVASTVLPPDAYAITLMMNHDMYEDDDDDFCCGRAYGASRISCISTSRYHPSLDTFQHVPRTHAWPASHCTSYLSSLLPPSSKKPTPPPKSPMTLALSSHTSSFPLSEHGLSSIYLSRTCRLASHELGHTLGMDHCTWYACVMQGTGSAAEDARQPMYLCPVHGRMVDEVTAGVGGREEDGTGAGVGMRERYGKVLEMIEGKGWEGSVGWAGFAGWLRGVLGEGGGERVEGGGESSEEAIVIGSSP